MSSYDDDTISIIEGNIFYNSSEWKPITFTLVEYPKGMVMQFIELNGTNHIHEFDS